MTEEELRDIEFLVNYEDDNGAEFYESCHEIVKKLVAEVRRLKYIEFKYESCSK